MTTEVRAARVDPGALRGQIRDKYTEVVLTPDKGFHFHTGRPLARMLAYDEAIVDWLPEAAVESFAGTGNPFSLGDLRPGEAVLNIGCGAGFDTLIAARQVGHAGRVIAVDMTPAMLEKAAGAREPGLFNIELRQGLAEELPAGSMS
jgi:arsenite methyltransferase